MRLKMITIEEVTRMVALLDEESRIEALELLQKGIMETLQIECDFVSNYAYRNMRDFAEIALSRATHYSRLYGEINDYKDVIRNGV
jgi:hypothetical protein